MGQEKSRWGLRRDAVLAKGEGCPRRRGRGFTGTGKHTVAAEAKAKWMMGGTSRLSRRLRDTSGGKAAGTARWDGEAHHVDYGEWKTYGGGGGKPQWEV